MNRKIKFRGKRKDNGRWIIGALIPNGSKYACIAPFKQAFDLIEVNSDTVGQFTGLHDKNGKEIYEGDILTADHYPFMKDGKMNYLAVVEWFEEDACFYASMQLHKDSTASGISVNCPAEFDKVVAGLYEVIGNIHDNIDLLKDYEK